MTLLRDRAQYQQLMEIAGVDYPDRPERFEVAYHLLSVTRNHRIRVKVSTDEDDAGADRHADLARSPAGSSAKCSTCMACCSRAIPTCAAS